MAKIIYAWEISSNSQQLAGVHPLLSELKRKGHHLTLVVKEKPCENFDFVDNVLSSPVVDNILSAPIHSYADILINHGGWHDPFKLRHMLTQWLNILEHEKPNLILVEFAPVAMLAAKVLNIPYLVYGNGWSIPPNETPFPVLPFKSASGDLLISSTHTALYTANQILSQEGLPLLKSLAELWDQQILLGHADLEYYSNVERSYVGNVLSFTGSHIPKWRQNGKYKVFVWLKGQHAGFQHVVHTLEQCHYDIIFATNADVSQYSPSNITFVSTNVNLAEMAEQADLGIVSGFHHVNHFIAKGTPLVMIPDQYEQLAYAQKVSSLEAGVISMPGDRALKQKVQKQLTTAVRKARKLQQKIAIDHDETLARCCAMIDKILNG